jgi:hypothetical protein
MEAIWSPQVGPQADAAICPADFTFYGGTRGSGKSDCLLGRQIRGAEKYAIHWNGLVLRRRYKEFAELRRRIDELIHKGLPAERIGGDQQANFLRFENGAQVAIFHKILTKHGVVKKSLTPMKAIREACMQCSNWQYIEITRCPANDCALWLYRLGKKPDQIGRKNRSE